MGLCCVDAWVGGQTEADGGRQRQTEGKQCVRRQKKTDADRWRQIETDGHKHRVREFVERIRNSTEKQACTHERTARHTHMYVHAVSTQ